MTTKKIGGSRIVDTQFLAAKGWPVIERGRHRPRRGKIHVSAFVPRLPVWNHPAAPVVIAILWFLAGVVVLAVVLLLMGLLMVAVLQLIGAIVAL